MITTSYCMDPPSLLRLLSFSVGVAPMSLVLLRDMSAGTPRVRALPASITSSTRFRSRASPQPGLGEKHRHVVAAYQTEPPRANAGSCTMVCDHREAREHTLASLIEPGNQPC